MGWYSVCGELSVLHSSKKINLYKLSKAFMFVCGVVFAPDATAGFATAQAATDALTAAVNGPVKAFNDLAPVDPAAVTTATTAINNLKTILAPYLNPDGSIKDPSLAAPLKTAVTEANTFVTTSLATLGKAPKKADEVAKFTAAQGTLTTAIATAGQAMALAAIVAAKTAATTALGTLPTSIDAANTALAAARKAFDDIAKDPMFGATPPAMPWAGAASTPAAPAPAPAPVPPR